MDESVFEIFPSIEDLSTIKSHLVCPDEQCNMSFTSGSGLDMHITRHHKRIEIERKQKGLYHYYCPVLGCVYYKKEPGSRCFKKMKYLKQHYLKVHAAKKWTCGKCVKGFSTETYRNSHEKVCGQVFSCSCKQEYTSSEALLTHCRRKGRDHVPLKLNLTPNGTNPLVNTACKETYSVTKPSQNIKMTDVPANKKGERLICPKPSSDSMPFSVQYFAAIALSELSIPHNGLSRLMDASCQTDELTELKLPKKLISNFAKGSLDKKRKNSKETQTGVVNGKCKKLKISTETQTMCQYKHKPSQKSHPRKWKKSMETQTKASVEEPRKLCNMKNNRFAETIDSKDDFGENSLQAHQDATLTSLVADKEVKTGSYDMKPSQFLDAGSLDAEIFADSSSSSSVSPQVATSKLQHENIDRTKQWVWDSQNFSKTEIVPSANNKRSFMTTVGRELFNMNSELTITDRENPLLRKEDIFVQANLHDNQTFDINKLCNIETQTDVHPLLPDCNEDTSFTLCSTIETQTTDDFASMLCSNMCTQTCEDTEVDQLFNFSFVDIETQTAWPDLNDYPSL